MESSGDHGRFGDFSGPQGKVVCAKHCCRELSVTSFHFLKMLRGGHYYLYFMSGETEAQRYHMTCPRSYSWDHAGFSTLGPISGSVLSSQNLLPLCTEPMSPLHVSDVSEHPDSLPNVPQVQGRPADPWPVTSSHRACFPRCLRCLLSPSPQHRASHVTGA